MDVVPCQAKLRAIETTERSATDDAHFHLCDCSGGIRKSLLCLAIKITKKVKVTRKQEERGQE